MNARITNPLDLFTALRKRSLFYDQDAFLASFFEDVGVVLTPYSYPPYNIEVVDDVTRKVVIAVAGFAEDEVDVATHQGYLMINGSKSKNDDTARHETERFIHHGIATRDFQLKFKLLSNVSVTDAAMNDGLLTVILEMEVPEEDKPQKIKINS